MAVALVRFVGVFKRRLIDYIVFCPAITTEICLAQVTRLCERLIGSNSANGPLDVPIYQLFFCCNISDKGSVLPVSGHTAYILGSTFSKAGSHPPGAAAGPQTDFLGQF
jgi:hypothetical protein